MSTTSKASRGSPPRSSERSRRGTRGPDPRAHDIGGDSDGSERPPPNAEEALRRAASHARSAAAELLLAARALIDAASLASSGRPADENRALARLASLFDEIAAHVGDRDGATTRNLVDALADALDTEIARWEERAAEDPEARAVLRAFLGLRELLWEFGIRRGNGPTEPRGGGETGKRRRGPRVQRVSVEG